MLRSFPGLVISMMALSVIPKASAIETQVSTGLLYFPADAEKLVRAETESAEDNLAFRAPRDPREVARELASDELRSGNVCLRQAKRDLRGVIGLSGPYDFLPLHMEVLKEIFGPEDRLPRTQPINFVTDRAPPMFLASGPAPPSSPSRQKM